MTGPRHHRAPRTRFRRALALFGAGMLAAATTSAGLALTPTATWKPSLPWQTHSGASLTSGAKPGTTAPTTADADPGVHGPSPAATTPSPSPTPTPPAVFTLVATGDVLPHRQVNESARTAGGYDYTELLAGIDAYVGGADLALCHMEVPLAPPGTAPTSYPVFGAPDHLPVDLKEQGWTGCSTASNHSLDKGLAGVRTTLDVFDASGLGHDGTARSAAEAAEPQIYQLTRNDQNVDVAQISAAYGTNGIPVPQSAPWSVRLIDAPSIIAEARQARADGADLVVVSLHAGQEYVSQPTAEQLAVTSALAESGQVDLVLGHHAHVPQPIAHLPGGPGGAGMWVAYGLGNMVSNQDSHCCSPKTDSGLLVTATVTKPADGPARVTGFEWTAITVDRQAGHRVEVLRDAIADPRGGTLPAAQLQQRWDRVRAVVGDAAPERLTPPARSGDPAVAVARKPATVAPGDGSTGTAPQQPDVDTVDSAQG